MFYYESNKAGNLIIESLYGPDLDKIFGFCNNDFDLKVFVTFELIY